MHQTTNAGMLIVNLSSQTLSLYSQDRSLLKTYPISSAKNGAGERMNSGCTPRGSHRIRAKIGENAPLGAVFVGRRPTGEIWTPAYGAAHPERDWILTRILWLCGNEPGLNRLGQVDSMRRYIYIHGTPDDQPMGKPCSHGCIRMRNQDIQVLFDQVAVGSEVLILEKM